MHVVVRRYPGASALSDELARREHEVREALAGTPGFVAYYAVRAGDDLITVTVCEDEDCAREAVRRELDWVKRTLPASVLVAPEIAEGETLVGVVA